jgi:hypothetical protein
MNLPMILGLLHIGALVSVVVDVAYSIVWFRKHWGVWMFGVRRGDYFFLACTSIPRENIWSGGIDNRNMRACQNLQAKKYQQCYQAFAAQR